VIGATRAGSTPGGRCINCNGQLAGPLGVLLPLGSLLTLLAAPLEAATAACRQRPGGNVPLGPYWHS